MYWDDLLLSEVGEWAASRTNEPPPPTLRFAPPALQLLTADATLAGLGLPGTTTPVGTVRLVDRDPQTLWAMALDYLSYMPLDRQLDEPDLRTDEYPPKFVARQGLTRVAGLPSIGPGGRITVYDLPSGAFADVSIRPRAEPVAAGAWRDPSDVQAAANGMVGDALGFRLRGAFGYSEPSAYETAGLVRPAFVLVLDGPPGEGRPQWRVSVAVPATDGGEDGGGEVSGRDSDWCV